MHQSDANDQSTGPFELYHRPHGKALKKGSLTSQQRESISTGLRHNIINPFERNLHKRLLRKNLLYGTLLVSCRLPHR